MKTKKNDFIEIEFTARDPEGNIFDTNIKSDAEKANLKIQNMKPFVLSIGHNMIIPGLDKDLEAKEIEKKYSIEIQPEEAFGKRNPKLVQMISLNQFKKQNIEPQRGMQFNLDGKIAKIVSVSGGRVLVDFNNPLAGKVVTYDYKINKKITNQDEKINALQDFFFRKQFEFEIKEETINFKIKENEKQFEKFITLMAKPFEEILNMKIKVEIAKKDSKS